jgi:hypothetical protein
MTSKKKADGQIITFYSFKGGVGRTMALANVAFLLAMNGKRVLTMDWDLEAPGLSYYFRGLLDAHDAKALKDAPGVLNILWDWSCSVKACQTDEDVEYLVSRFGQGSPFLSCVRSLSSSQFLPDGALLDFIGAGNKVVNTPEEKTYEEALAHFSWPTFFENESGGLMLDALRKWCKKTYDVVLIDSRTGLADVAGICTMQIPDVVALCFVLNRQNIDGVARIATAIRANRSDEVSIRALPMRVSREGTPEESDARARAINELTRIGGLPSDSIIDDFRLLSVKAADNVPFYETLAPFTAPDPSLDPLTFNYIRLGSQLIGQPLEVPALQTDLIETVRSRLQPRNATAEYVANLKSAEPSRAISELQRLIESAFDTDSDGGQLDDDYVNALIETSFDIAVLSDDFSSAAELHTRTLDFLRTLSTNGPNKWKTALISAIEKTLETPIFFLETEEELAFLEELDVLLASTPNIETRLKRLLYRRQAARSYLSEFNNDSAMQTVGEIRALAKDIMKSSAALTPHQADEVLAGEVEASIICGDVYATESPDRARKEYNNGLARLLSIEHGVPKVALSRLRSDLHSRLALLQSDVALDGVAAEHAIQALKWGANFWSVQSRFVKLAKVVLNAPDRENIVFEFCESTTAVLDNRGQSSLVSYYGRQPKLSISLLDTFSSLTQAIAPLGIRKTVRILRFFVEVSSKLLHNLARRRRTMGAKQLELLPPKISDLMSALSNAGLPNAENSELMGVIELFGTSRSRGDLPEQSNEPKD